MTTSQYLEAAKIDFWSYFCRPAQIGLAQTLTNGQFCKLDTAAFIGYNMIDV